MRCVLPADEAQICIDSPFGFMSDSGACGLGRVSAPCATPRHLCDRYLLGHWPQSDTGNAMCQSMPPYRFNRQPKG